MKKIYSFIILMSCFLPNFIIGQCTTPTTVPYFEGFEGITLTNEFPQCWTASNPSVTCLTFTSGTSQSGSKMAGFYYSPGSTGYFYSRLIHLNSGVTYSANLFYRTSGNGSSISWSNLKLSYGPNQAATGLTTIANINGNVVSPAYSGLSNTFVVASTGDYYLAVNATSNGGGSDFYLYFDDLSVTVPCGVANNSPTVSIALSQNPACANDIITYTVSGADYYSTGAGTGTFISTTYTFSPLATNNLSVVGTSTLTGCSALATVMLTVSPSPVVIAFSSKPSVCLGESVNLTATGNAGSYVWSYNQSNALNIMVSPTVTTVYTVTGYGSGGCTASSTVAVSVNPNPSFTVTSNPLPTAICYGESVTLTGTTSLSSLSYQWSSQNNFFSGSPVTTTILAPTVFTITGTDLNGCKTTVQYAMSGTFCGMGIKENLVDGAYRIYPSPFSESITLHSENNDVKSIEVVDISGKLIKTQSSGQNEVNIDLSSCDKGMYYVRIRSEYKSSVMRIIKN